MSNCLRRMRMRHGIDASTGVLMAGLVWAITTSLGMWLILGIRLGHALTALVLCGAVIGAWKLRVVVAMTGALALVYAVVAWTPIIHGPASRWVRNDTFPDSAQPVVVTSGAFIPPGILSDQGAERLLYGVEVAKRIGGDILTTESVYEEDAVRVSSLPDQQRIVAVAGLAARWRSTGGVVSTRSEAQRTAELLSPATSIVVVTSALHTRRACGAFEAVGFRVTCLAAPDRHGVFNRGDRLFRDYAYERIGYWIYHRRGWIQ